MSGGALPSENVFVGDLPPDIDDLKLQAVFGAYGAIKTFRILPPGSRGGGNAVITFGSVGEATWIVENLNGNIPQGLSSPIQVRYKDAPKGKGKDKGGGPAPQQALGWQPQQAVGDASAQASDSVFLADLPIGTDEEKLRAVLGAYGSIMSAKIVRGGSNGKPCAVMTFGSVGEAQWIVNNLNGNIPQGFMEPILVRFKAPKGKGKGDGGGSGAGGWQSDWQQAPAAAQGGGGWQGDWQQNSGGGQQGGKASASAETTVFVGDLPPNFDEKSLRSVFDAYGSIASHRMLTPGSSGKSAALLTFTAREQAEWLVNNVNGNIPQGLSEPVTVRFKETKGEKGKGSGGGAKERQSPYGDSWKGGYDGGKGGYDGGKGRYDGKGGGYDGGRGGGYDGGKGGYDGGKGGYGDYGDGGYGYGEDYGPCSIRSLIEGLFASGAMPGAKDQSSDDRTLFIGGLPYDMTDADLYRLFSPFGALEQSGAKVARGDVNPCRGFGFVNFQEASSCEAAVAALHGRKTPEGKDLRVNYKKVNQAGQ